MEEYKDPDILMELHWDRDMSMREIGQVYDVSHRTIGYWFDKHDLPRRGVGGEYPYAHFFTAPETTNSGGYEHWRTRVDGEKVQVRVHRLLAVAKYGFDAVEDMTVHHKNHIKWDNRPENIELRENSDHADLHYEEQIERGEEFWKYREEVTA